MHGLWAIARSHAINAVKNWNQSGIDHFKRVFSIFCSFPPYYFLNRIISHLLLPLLAHPKDRQPNDVLSSLAVQGHFVADQIGWRRGICDIVAPMFAPQSASTSEWTRWLGAYHNDICREWLSTHAANCAFAVRTTIAVSNRLKAHHWQIFAAMADREEVEARWRAASIKEIQRSF